jgi:fructuronate reductase
MKRLPPRSQIPALSGYPGDDGVEISSTLKLGPGMNLASYQAALIDRFRNPALKHRTWQIAMDGSQKLPQRLLATIRDRLKTDAPFPRLALGVAAWMRYVSGFDEQGQPIDVRDPMAARLRNIADRAGPHADRLGPALMEVEEIFGTDLPLDPRFRHAVAAALDRLFLAGAHRSVVELNEAH